MELTGVPAFTLTSRWLYLFFTQREPGPS
jgi:hypothetical protein